MSGSCFIHLSCCLLLVMFEPWCLKIHSVPYDVDWSISNFRTRNFVTQASKKSALVSDLIRCCRVRTENNLFPCSLLVFDKPRTMRVFSKKKKRNSFRVASQVGEMGDWRVFESPCCLQSVPCRNHLNAGASGALPPMGTRGKKERDMQGTT